MKDLLKQLFDKYQITYNLEQIEKLSDFYEMVIETNKQFNLTAITEKKDFAIKHLLDSVLPYKYLPQNSKVIDIGAGAGFPSIPLKIMRDDLTVVMLDSLNKRVNFLNSVVEKLKLINISAIHSRAEDYAQNNRESFDVAVARAVANLTTLSEYCLPLVKVGGMFIAYKSENLKEEIAQSEFAIATLGGVIDSTQKVVVDEIQSIRENLLVKKVKVTPKKYPRGKNLPRLKPLMG